MYASWASDSKIQEATGNLSGNKRQVQKHLSSEQAALGKLG